MIKRLIKRAVVTGISEEPGQAVAVALKRRGWLVVGTDSVFCPHQVHQFYILSKGDHCGFVDEMILLVRRERTTLIVPTRLAECRALSLRQGELQILGAGLYLPTPMVIDELASPGALSNAFKRIRRSFFESSGGEGTTQRFEVTLCRDRDSYTSCAVFELEDRGSSALHADRRKGEEDIERLAQAAGDTLTLHGPATVHIDRASDGRLDVTGVALSPCVHAPLTDDVLDGLLVLWERDQPA